MTTAPKPPAVEVVTAYSGFAPESLSPRCLWLLMRAQCGVLPDKGTHLSEAREYAESLGVWVWEWENVLRPLLVVLNSPVEVFDADDIAECWADVWAWTERDLTVLVSEVEAWRKSAVLLSDPEYRERLAANRIAPFDPDDYVEVHRPE